MPTPDQPLIDNLLRNLKGANTNGNGKHQASKEGVAGETKVVDSFLLEKLFGEKDKGQQWRAVYNGDFERYYSSPSEAVAALLRKLAFYSGNDPLQMEQLIRDSGLSSDKFDGRRGGSTWIQNEIASAIEDTTETYTPPKKQSTKQETKGEKKKAKGGTAEQEAPTHDELRDRWLAGHQRYAFGLEEWRRYEGGIWPPIKSPLVRRSIVRSLEEAKAEGIKPSVFVLNSVQELVRLEVYVEDELWDADPNILVAENGAIDIATGNLLPHSPGYYCTTRVPYAFDDNAKSPNWDRFIGCLDKAVATFLQEFAGYCLTTDTSLEKAIWFIGPPGGGKSTFIEGQTATLGVRAGVLGLAEIEKSRFALAKLAGKTLVTAAEQPAGFVTCHHILNAIISGEPVQVERKYRDAYDLTPRAKIVWAMNELPRIPSGAEGLFRRVEVIKFPEIAPEDRDPTLKEGIKSEGAGILNWALEGLMRLRRRGNFDVPTKITDATAEFREHNDIVGQFVEERCITGEGREIKSSELYSEYKHWCETTNHKPKNSTSIVQDWERLGFQKKPRKTGNYWLGVDLKEHERFRESGA